MNITFLELRKKPSKLLDAISRRETITLSRRGKKVAAVTPLGQEKTTQASEHRAFGMWSDHQGLGDVLSFVRSLRQGRF
ncbi:MAG: hypothetical protein PHQ23_04350 [Candidatus Wallbacteria bacterium]|nr:hypothetical protein [Candidatus Wallbacteria bacterium]